LICAFFTSLIITFLVKFEVNDVKMLTYTVWTIEMKLKQNCFVSVSFQLCGQF